MGLWTNLNGGNEEGRIIDYDYNGLWLETQSIISTVLPTALISLNHFQIRQVSRLKLLKLSLNDLFILPRFSVSYVVFSHQTSAAALFPICYLCLVYTFFLPQILTPDLFQIAGFLKNLGYVPPEVPQTASLSRKGSSLLLTACCEVEVKKGPGPIAISFPFN